MELENVLTDLLNRSYRQRMSPFLLLARKSLICKWRIGKGELLALVMFVAVSMFYYLEAATPHDSAKYLETLKAMNDQDVTADSKETDSRFPYFNGIGHIWDWSVAYAKVEARADIASRKVKIYHTLFGNNCLPAQLWDFVEKYPQIYSGFTDAGDTNYFKRAINQAEYAKIYNREIVRFLLIQSGRRAEELDEAWADEEGQKRATEMFINRKLDEAARRRIQ